MESHENFLGDRLNFGEVI
jgi:hypothetical protein